eukprot:scaffold5872_cov104-Isochrysis_galbana.AAC.11
MVRTAARASDSLRSSCDRNEPHRERGKGGSGSGSGVRQGAVPACRAGERGGQGRRRRRGGGSGVCSRACPAHVACDPALRPGGGGTALGAPVEAGRKVPGNQGVGSVTAGSVRGPGVFFFLQRVRGWEKEAIIGVSHNLYYARIVVLTCSAPRVAAGNGTACGSPASPPPEMCTASAARAAALSPAPPPAAAALSADPNQKERISAARVCGSATRLARSVASSCPACTRAAWPSLPSIPSRACVPFGRSAGWCKSGGRPSAANACGMAGMGGKRGARGGGRRRGEGVSGAKRRWSRKGWGWAWNSDFVFEEG